MLIMAGQVHSYSAHSLPPSNSQIIFFPNSFAFTSESYNDSKVLIHDASSATVPVIMTDQTGLSCLSDVSVPKTENFQNRESRKVCGQR